MWKYSGECRETLSRIQHSLSNQIRQVSDEADLFDSVFEISPKRYAKFTARLFQTGKCITAPATGVTTGTTTDFAFFHLLPDSVFRAIVMQRNIRTVQNQQQLGFVVVNSLEG